MTMQKLSVTAPTLNHKYYSSLMFKSSNTFEYVSTYDSRYEWYYSDALGADIIFTEKKIKTTNWTRLSSIQQVTTSTYLNQTWYIRNFQRGATEYSYSDDLILIDLTEAFGSGNEPDKEWCDNNINYFDGTTTIYK